MHVRMYLTSDKKKEKKICTRKGTLKWMVGLLGRRHMRDMENSEPLRSRNPIDNG